MKLKRIAAMLLACAMGTMVFTACSSTTTESSSSSEASTSSTSSASSTVESSSEAESSEETATGSTIVVISREDGSGTRGAFTELFGLLDSDKNDMTVETAQITNSTGVMMTTVSGNEDAIGYISLGSLDDSVKALTIDGVEATVDNIISGDYTISRPFNLATNGDLTNEVGIDFMNFISSAEGQAVIEDNKYIGVSADAAAFTSTNPTGTLVIAGSSSVSPLMEALVEAYAAINSGANIEIQTSDSTTGMNSALDGICDIGMASRELKDSEIEAGLVPTVMAMDGLAVVVNNNNAISDISSDSVTGIYLGEITTWDMV